MVSSRHKDNGSDFHSFLKWLCAYTSPELGYDAEIEPKGEFISNKTPDVVLRNNCNRKLYNPVYIEIQKDMKGGKYEIEQRKIYGNKFLLILEEEWFEDYYFTLVDRKMDVLKHMIEFVKDYLEIHTLKPNIKCENVPSNRKSRLIIKEECEWCGMKVKNIKKHNTTCPRRKKILGGKE